MKNLILTFVAFASVLSASAAATGSCESKAVSISASGTLQRKTVTLVNEWNGKKSLTNGVYYFKMTLKKGTAYTVWLDFGEGKTSDAVYIEDAYQSWGDFELMPPAAFFERATVGETYRWVVDGKTWDYDDFGGGDWGGGEWDIKVPSTWVYYIRVMGSPGDKAVLCYQTGNRIPTGVEQNPLVLTPKTTVQETGAFVFYSKEYCVRMAMKADHRYHFRTLGGTDSVAISVDGAPYGVIRDLSKGDTNNCVTSIAPFKSGTYTLRFLSSAESYNDSTAAAIKLSYWVDADRTIAQHPVTGTLVANEPLPCVPGHLNDPETHSYDAIIDQQLFKFAAKKGQNYIVRTIGAETNLTMRLYDANGKILVENKGDGMGFDVRCALSAPSKNATYYVGVCQDLGGEDDLLEPVYWPVQIVLQPVASVTGVTLPLTAVPGNREDDPVVRDGVGTTVPDLGTNVWYDTFSLPARKNVTYALRTSLVDDMPSRYPLTAEIYYKSGSKTVKVMTEYITPSLTNAVAFTATATRTYYMKLRVSEGLALDYPRVRLHAIGYDFEGKTAYGSLTVTPEGTEKAQWTLDKETVKYGIGSSILVSTSAVHTVKFTNVSGYKTPASVTGVRTTAGEDTAVEGLQARYVDDREPGDNTASKPTAWTLKQKKATSFARTLWEDDPADVFSLTPANGRYYDISIANSTADAVFTIRRADGTNFCTNVKSVSKLQLPKSSSKYYLTVSHENESEPVGGVYTLTGLYNEVGTIGFAKTAYSAKDTATTVTLVVKRTAKDGAVSVRYSTADGTAIAGEHYVATNGVLTWAANNKSDKKITVKLIPKAGAWYAGGNKAFQVHLEDADGEFPAQITSPVSTVTLTETSKTTVTQESVYAKKAAKTVVLKPSAIDRKPMELGTYWGVVRLTGDALTNGLPEFAAVTVTTAVGKKGVTNFSASVSVAGKKYAFSASGAWDDYSEGGSAEKRLTMTFKPSSKSKIVYTNTLDFVAKTEPMENWKDAFAELALDLVVPDGSGWSHATAESQRLARRNAGVQEYLDAAARFAGYYTLSLLPDGVRGTDGGEPDAGVPAGNGYLTLTVSNVGTVKIAGKLADGSAVSAAVTAAPIVEDPDGGPLGLKMIVQPYVAKSPWLLAGELVLCAQDPVRPRPDGRAYDLAIDESQSCLVWNNDSKTATLTGTQGWRMDVRPAGGWYDTVFNLQNYYRTYSYVVAPNGCAMEFPKEALSAGYDYVLGAGPADVGVELSGNSLAAKASLSGLKVSFARATGIVSGSFSLVTANEAGKQKKITGVKHYGILTQDRAMHSWLNTLQGTDRLLTAGFSLQEVKLPVTTKKTRTWKSSLEFDLVAEE